MKWAVFTLLLLNLLIFVWHYQAPVSKRHHAGDQLTRLVLLKEYQQRLKLDGGDVSGSCYSLGPFSRRESYEYARQKLSAEGVEVIGRVSSDSVRKGYWVLIPVSTSRNQAMVTIQKLKEQGIKEYFLVDTGEMKNAISLGIFSKPKLARRRVEAIEKQGFNPVIRKIAIPKRVYWLEWARQAAPQPSQSLLTGLREKYQEIGQSEKQCIQAKKP